MTSSCSSAAAQYIVGQAGTRQKPRRAFIVGVAGLLIKWLLWARPLSFVAEGWRGGVSHPTPNVAVASDGSPATSDSAAAARPEATFHAKTLQQNLLEESRCRNDGQQAEFCNAQVKNKTTKRPTPELPPKGAGRIVRGGRQVLAPVYHVFGIRASDPLYPARGRELPPR